MRQGKNFPIELERSVRTVKLEVAYLSAFQRIENGIGNTQDVGVTDKRAVLMFRIEKAHSSCGVHVVYFGGASTLTPGRWCHMPSVTVSGGIVEFDIGNEAVVADVLPPCVDTLTDRKDNAQIFEHCQFVRQVFFGFGRSGNGAGGRLRRCLGPGLCTGCA